MRIIPAQVKLIGPVDGSDILRRIEMAGRVCYKSENRITEDSAAKFVRQVIERGHESVLEHVSLTVKFICDRGISHELVRHRLASYSQESTRYCNYADDKFNGEITVIKPFFFDEGTKAYDTWLASCRSAEKAYFQLLNYGVQPQEARSVLPNSLKTEVVMTANVREWRHFMSLRAAPPAHPQMKELSYQLLEIFRTKIPVLFDDVGQPR